MQFNLKNGRPIAIIRGGKYDGEFIHLFEGKDKHNMGKHIKITDGVFEPIPNTTTRDIFYIAGPSGSGKSTQSAKIIKNYKAMFPDRDIFVVSKLIDDKALDGLDCKRIDANELLENPLDITEEVTEPCLFLFDDVDTFSDPKMVKVLNDLKNDILELGRHFDIHAIFCSHLINPNDKKFGRTIMNEMHNLTMFKGGNVYQQTYCLKNYFGFDKKTIKKILDTPGRWVMVNKNFPQYILSEKEIEML